MNQSSASLQSISSQISNLSLDPNAQDEHDATDGGQAPKTNDDGQPHHALLSQVVNWLQEERAKRVTRRFKGAEDSSTMEADPESSIEQAESFDDSVARPRSTSEVSEAALALDKLERILAKHAALGKDALASALLGHKKSNSALRRPSSIRKLKRGSTAGSSDTDYQDGDVMVPSVDAVLDNSKTLAYTGGTAEAEIEGVSPGKRSKDKEHWVTFKCEIVRLAHTLRLKGWRKVPIDLGGEIDVERLSGALTNAVYVVSPPKNLPGQLSNRKDSTTSLAPKKPPP